MTNFPFKQKNSEYKIFIEAENKEKAKEIYNELFLKFIKK